MLFRSAVGLTVGIFDGLAVGVTVGKLLGLPVGLRVGFGVGRAVGFDLALGDDVGLAFPFVLAAADITSSEEIVLVSELEVMSIGLLISPFPDLFVAFITRDPGVTWLLLP